MQSDISKKTAKNTPILKYNLEIKRSSHHEYYGNRIKAVVDFLISISIDRYANRVL